MSGGAQGNDHAACAGDGGVGNQRDDRVPALPVAVCDRDLVGCAQNLDATGCSAVLEGQKAGSADLSDGRDQPIQAQSRVAGHPGAVGDGQTNPRDSDFPGRDGACAGFDHQTIASGLQRARSPV